jgi:hypothetical protein
MVDDSDEDNSDDEMVDDSDEDNSDDEMVDDSDEVAKFEKLNKLIEMIGFVKKRLKEKDIKSFNIFVNDKLCIQQFEGNLIYNFYEGEYINPKLIGHNIDFKA